MAIHEPTFYRYYAQTYRIDKVPNGGLAGTLLDLRTGFFVQDGSHIHEVLRATTDSNISGPMSEEKFVQETEFARSRYLTGDGPIFALYETVRGIDDLASKEGRRRTPQETALVQALRKRTFKMWEDEATRRAAGEAPTFEAKPRYPRQ
ncbi:MAG: hypothetical protein QOI78_7683 [Actinomycetota bacterium]|jgi:hypothetical protein|nr:hypothetical protein [Actinomycetota bacterium]